MLLVTRNYMVTFRRGFHLPLLLVPMIDGDTSCAFHISILQASAMAPFLLYFIFIPFITIMVVDDSWLILVLLITALGYLNV